MAQRRVKPKSEYGLQLEEKQALKKTYGLREKKFRRYFDEEKEPEKIFKALESRFDNVVFRAGFTHTRGFARQMVNHGHFQVNGKNVNFPSLHLKKGDVVSIRPSSKNIAPFKDLSITFKKYESPKWISINRDALTAEVRTDPMADDALISSTIRPIIEFYSR